MKPNQTRYHFLNLWCDSTWDWTPVFQTFSEHYSFAHCEYFSDENNFYRKNLIIRAYYYCWVFLFFQALLITLSWYIYIVITQECYLIFSTNPGSSTLQNNSCTATYPPSFAIHPRWRRHAGYWWLRTNSKVTFSYRLLDMDASRLAEQTGRKYVSSVRTLNLV